MTTRLFIGGVVAAGFDPTGQYLLVVSHAGRGVFLRESWQRIARDTTLSYPTEGYSVGIGPIAGQRIKVTEINYDTEILSFTTSDGRYSVHYAEGDFDISSL